MICIMIYAVSPILLATLVVGAERPLRLDEIDVALNLCEKMSCSRSEDLDLDRKKFRERIRIVCGLFVYVSEQDRVFLIHETARSFLLGHQVLSRAKTEEHEIYLDFSACQKCLQVHICTISGWVTLATISKFGKLQNAGLLLMVGSLRRPKISIRTGLPRAFQRAPRSSDLDSPS